MRKLILIITMIIAMRGYSQKTSPEIQSYLNSADYARFVSSSQFSSNGVVDLQQSFVDYEIRENKRIPVFTVSFVTSAGSRTIVGQIQAVRLKDDFNGLPGNAKYLQLYRDFRNFDHSTESGVINVHDLNFGEYLCTTATLSKGEVIQLTNNPMPQHIAERFAGGVPAAPGAHVCDLNQNGNVTFAECFQCYTASCAASPACVVACALMNSVVKHVCTASIVANCIAVSIIY